MESSSDDAFLVDAILRELQGLVPKRRGSFRIGDQMVSAPSLTTSPDAANDPTLGSEDDEPPSSASESRHIGSEGVTHSAKPSANSDHSGSFFRQSADGVKSGSNSMATRVPRHRALRRLSAISSTPPQKRRCGDLSRGNQRHCATAQGGRRGFATPALTKVLL